MADSRRWTILVAKDGRAVLGGAADPDQIFLSQDLIAHERVQVMPVTDAECGEEHRSQPTQDIFPFHHRCVRAAGHEGIHISKEGFIWARTL